jgi:hypothetical protein
MPTDDMLRNALVGYLLTILIETPVLLVGLSRRHPVSRRLFAGVWLTACTYPVVAVVLPIALDAEHHWARYLTVAEIFAPLAECSLFWVTFIKDRPPPDRRATARDLAAVVLANLLSFGTGEALRAMEWW